MIERLSFRHEPAAWIGLIASILLAVNQQLQGGEFDLALLLPVLLGLITRFFVSAADEPGI